MTVLWAGLALGALYALVAMLFNIAMAQSGVFNFAVPQIVMVGAFVGYEMSGVSAGVGGLLLAVAIGVVLGAALGAAVEMVAVRPVLLRGHGVLITTVGAAFVIEGIVLARYGVDGQQVALAGLNDYTTVFGGTLARVDIVLIVLALMAVVGLEALCRGTRWGLEGRAVTMDAESAQLRGINTALNRLGVFALAGGLAAVLGVLVAVKINASYELGASLLVYAFVAFAVGGIGSFRGCLLGGLIVGLLEAYSARYIGAESSLMLAFALLVATLMIRPAGLLGARELRMV
jgi:branched-chain amino acid transport system permease protein